MASLNGVPVRPKPVINSNDPLLCCHLLSFKTWHLHPETCCDLLSPKPFHPWYHTPDQRDEAMVPAGPCGFHKGNVLPWAAPAAPRRALQGRIRQPQRKRWMVCRPRLWGCDVPPWFPPCSGKIFLQTSTPCWVYGSVGMGKSTPPRFAIKWQRHLLSPFGDLITKNKGSLGCYWLSMICSPKAHIKHDRERRSLSKFGGRPCVDILI